MTQHQKDDAVEKDQETTKETPKAAGEWDLEDFEATPRAKVYESLDRANKAEKGVPFLFGGEVEDDLTEPAEPSEEVAEEEPEVEGEAVPAEKPRTEDPKLGEKVLSREEFEEIFKDVKIKTRVAGEEVEAPVRDFIKATGLEKHYTKRLQELSRREREVLKNARVEDQAGKGPSDEEIAEKYDELYAESPYKAQQFLKQVEEEKEVASRATGQARIDRAIADFKSIYPECTDAEWDAMNDSKFWSQHEDIVKLRDQGDVFATLVTAYTRLSSDKVKAQAVDEASKAKVKPSSDSKLERKKLGQVVRTQVKPQATPSKKKNFKEESASDYIRALQKQARERMNLK